MYSMRYLHRHHPKNEDVKVSTPPVFPKVVEAETMAYLREGLQTKHTKAVMDFASRHPGSDLKTVEAIVKDISSFEEVRYRIDDLRREYSRRTANEIISKREVAVGVLDDKGEESVLGCIDYNLALCAVLRAKGIPAKFTRRADHSETHFFLDGIWHSADPILQRVADRQGGLDPDSPMKPVMPLSDPIRRLNEMMRSKGKYAEGLDAWDIGIRTWKDFKRYSG